VGDPEVLRLAADTGRVLVSDDVGTLPFHFRAFTAGRHSRGVFLIPQNIDIAVAIDEILLIWLASESWEWKDRLEWLPF